MEQQIKEYDSLSEVLEDLDSREVYGYQRYKIVNKFVTLKARYKDIPVSGSFELTPLCNLDCKMCYVHLKREQMAERECLLTVSEWKEIIREAVDAGMMFASLTGGECLTYPGFREVYLCLVSHGIQPDVLTNGRLLTEETVSFFKKYPPGVIQVTIYGSDENAYETVTGHRAFHQVIDGITRVKEAGLNLFLTVSPSIYMKNDVKPLLELIHSLNVPYAIGDTTLQARAETERNIADYAVEIDTLREIKRIEREFYASMQKTPSFSQPIQYVPAVRHQLKGLPCGGAHSSFHVNWKGEICPCIGFSESVRSKILDKGFDRAFQAIREIMQGYIPPSECEVCQMKEQCVTCPAEKTNSVLRGQLNTSVCQRLNHYLLDRATTEANSCTLQ